MIRQVSAARDMFEGGDLWRDQITRLALPIVIWCAKNGRRITYKQLAEEIERRHGEEPKRSWTLYGMPAGKIGDIMEELSKEWAETVLPVNAVIVNGDTKLPGDGVHGYLVRFLKRKRMDDGERKALSEEVIQRVFQYPKWLAVARHLGIESLPAVEVLEEEPLRVPAPVTLQGGGGEGEEHRELKEWLAHHPEAFAQYGKFGRGKVEVLLSSGDEIDVVFADRDSVLGVEVKTASAPESEIWRGIFQVVKYRAVLRAMQLVDGEPPNAQVVLAVGRGLSDDQVAAAQRLGVQWVVVS